MVDPYYMGEQELENEIKAWAPAMQPINGSVQSVIGWLASELGDDKILETARRRANYVAEQLITKRNKRLEAQAARFDWLAPLLHVDPGERP